MKKNTKIILAILLIIIAGGAVAGWLMWHKPRRNVADEKGINITAVQLVKEFQANEAEATKKYIDKAIEVTGAVSEVKNNKEGKTTVMLASEDAFAGVFCTLKEKSEAMNAGATVTLKGVCTGMMSDVHLRDAIVIK